MGLGFSLYAAPLLFVWCPRFQRTEIKMEGGSTEVLLVDIQAKYTAEYLQVYIVQRSIGLVYGMEGMSKMEVGN